ncbi:2-dehydro-3-deoxygalactonokinase [Cucumibacter marinus]|uniref:2-dehydro-3-deoxygalactonokinase n=1 Tax=Cucumibacter marinus TaxID=1121252 RepID=UPI000491DFF9|nr:2-dehydro-3-deoxygalactonokinase [Cucumibacter marinus]
MTQAISSLAIDWGSSNRRLWGLNDAGNIVWHAADNVGGAGLSPDQFEPALMAAIADLELGIEVPIVICGMAGSRQGWVEAPYLEAPTALSELARHTARAAAHELTQAVFLVPGIADRQNGRFDVMRGEETQVLGLLSAQPGFRGSICTPGTHSKWIAIENDLLIGFATAMTGEMFSVLNSHSVLRHSLPVQQDGVADSSAFDTGVNEALGNPDQLLTNLFQVRTRSLLADASPDWCRGYLSGLLIGAEIAACAPKTTAAPVPVIAGEALGGLYRRALELAGHKAQIVSGESAVLAGLKTVISSIAP